MRVEQAALDRKGFFDIVERASIGACTNACAVLMDRETAKMKHRAVRRETPQIMEKLCETKKTLAYRQLKFQEGADVHTIKQLHHVVYF